jgi:two-component system LytT family sensor kinase
MSNSERASSTIATFVVVCGCLALGGVGALESRHMSVTHGLPLAWPTVLISTMPRWIGLALAMPFVVRLSTVVPLAPVRRRVVVLHIALFLAISLLHAALDTWSVGYVTPMVAYVFPLLARLTRSWYSTMPTVFAIYAAVVFATWGMSEARERQRRTLRASQLEAQLQTARLAALRAQLQPHFLYNTLNAIAALVTDVQPARAVAAIEQLSELLHASLRDDGREEIRIDEEVVLVERYLALQQMRFGERLRYRCHVDPDLVDCLVPVLLLQPIVENAVVHGLDAGQTTLDVAIDVVPTANGLRITVENDGALVGTNPPRAGGHGVGIAGTRARLQTIHGDRASLSLTPRPNGGAIVCIEIPKRAVTRPSDVASRPAMQPA